jgi:2-oxoglutarate ferredoxin oxidoreductase subunit beta
MGLSYGASFVARLFAGEPRIIAETLIQGIQNPGFSFFHVYTSCVTFDKQYKTWSNLKERVHPLPEDHDSSDLKAAMSLAIDDDYALGIFFRKQK